MIWPLPAKVSLVTGIPRTGGGSIDWVLPRTIRDAHPGSGVDVYHIRVVDGANKVIEYDVKVFVADPPRPTPPPSSMVQLVLSPSLTGSVYGDVLAVDQSGTLWRFPSSRTGTLGTKVKVGTGWQGLKVYAASDVNSDGKADILSIDGRGDLYLYKGKGNGTFMKKIKVGNGWKGYQLAAGADLNRDGVADIVSRAANGVLYFYPAKGGGLFGKKIQIGNGW
ncbi:MAG: VCBS repeat-containing protein [Micrococcales bacterium]|nr:VCBS repeat-containing protein [Micrococcales bacterium]